MQETWDWIVYPSDRARPMVATGVRGTEGQARADVEHVLADKAEAAWGLTMHAGQHMLCRRSAKGYVWRDVHPCPI